jgi:hypothetical protein
MEHRMKAFVVFVNGQRICTIGLKRNNTRGVGLHWIGGPEGLVFLHAGGMDDREHVDWEMPDVGVGDEVTVRVVECNETDPPSRRQTVEEVDAWARSLKPKTEREKQIDKEMPRLPAPWE